MPARLGGSARPSTRASTAATSGDVLAVLPAAEPRPTPADATVRYLRPFGAGADRAHLHAAADSRVTIPVDDVAPELAVDRRVGRDQRSAQPIIVERAMYLHAPGAAVRGRPRVGRRDRAGDAAGSSRKARPGRSSICFVLLANPSTSTATTVDVDYLLSDGRDAPQALQPAAGAAAPRSGSTTSSCRPDRGSGRSPTSRSRRTVTSTNGVPIIVERTMWWPGPKWRRRPFWTEAHNSAGATATGTLWALAEGEVGRAAERRDVRPDRQHVGGRRQRPGHALLSRAVVRPCQRTFSAAAEQPDERERRRRTSRPRRTRAFGPASRASARRRRRSSSSARSHTSPAGRRGPRGPTPWGRSCSSGDRARRRVRRSPRQHDRCECD